MNKFRAYSVFLFLSIFLISSCSYSNDATIKNAIKSFQKQEYQKTIQLLSPLAEKDTNGIINFYIGWSYHSLRNIELAKKHYLLANKINDKFPEALNNLGILYSEENDYDNAYKCLNKAIELEPNFAIALSTLASLYLDEAKYDEAEKILLKAVMIDPKDPFVNYNLGFLYYFKSEKEKSIQYFKKYLEIYDITGTDTSVSGVNFHDSAIEYLKILEEN